jgi:hypothetical protein
MTTIENKTKPAIKLKFNQNYNSFPEFMSENREIIYRKTIKIFDQLTKTDEDKLILFVEANVENVLFTTDLIYSKNDKDMLKEIMIPYFEGLEDYETCAEILETYKKL